ncbi:MAG: hypothetical protein NXI32_17875 [bacterium]|nr:hypothetical protein [bacterium]
MLACYDQVSIAFEAAHELAGLVEAFKRLALVPDAKAVYPLCREMHGRRDVFLSTWEFIAKDARETIPKILRSANEEVVFAGEYFTCWLEAACDFLDWVYGVVKPTGTDGLSDTVAARDEWLVIAHLLERPLGNKSQLLAGLKREFAMLTPFEANYYQLGEDGFRRDAKIYELVSRKWNNADIVQELEKLAPTENWDPVGVSSIKDCLNRYIKFTGKPPLVRKGGRPKNRE